MSRKVLVFRKFYSLSWFCLETFSRSTEKSLRVLLATPWNPWECQFHKNGVIKKCVYMGSIPINFKNFSVVESVETRKKILERRSKRFSRKNVRGMTRSFWYLCVRIFFGCKRGCHDVFSFLQIGKQWIAQKFILVSAKCRKLFGSAHRNFPALWCFIIFRKIFATFEVCIVYLMCR